MGSKNNLIRKTQWLINKDWSCWKNNPPSPPPHNSIPVSPPPENPQTPPPPKKKRPTYNPNKQKQTNIIYLFFKCCNKKEYIFSFSQQLDPVDFRCNF